MLRHPRQWWRGLDLGRQFVLAGSAVLLPGMALMGAWVAAQIQDGVTRNSGVAAALYMSSFIAPLVQELSASPALGEETMARLDALVAQPELQRIVAMKIWRLDGTVVYDTQKKRIGRTFELTPKFQAAARGEMAAEFEGEHHEDHEHASGPDMPLLEIYAPVRQRESNRIIAVAEFYERGDELKADLWRATASSWLVVGGVALVMMAALSGIVFRGSRTIDEQRHRLERQVQELGALLQQNANLGLAVQRAYHRTADLNEQFLRRVGADLHDGPAQLLSLALLNIDNVQQLARKAGLADAEVQRLRAVLFDAMQEIRTISAGLVLPELGKVSLDATITMAVRDYTQRTGVRVRSQVTPLPLDVPRDLKVCAYRFVQEALNNGFLHAAGADQSVEASASEGIVAISVSDRGGGMTQDRAPATARKSGGLGLKGLRDRIEALGGKLQVESRAGFGTTLLAQFSLEQVRRMEQLYGQ
jgi:signal transduction histidine kinase